MKEKLEAIILDWAGTTLDYGCYAPAVVFRKVFDDIGVPITIEEARKPMGAHKKVHIREITNMPSVRERWYAEHNKHPDEGDVETLFANFVPAQMACLANYADLIPGTSEAMAKFREMGLKIGSTTGYTGEMMELLLDEAAKRGYTPDVSVCSTGRWAVRDDNHYRFGQLEGIGKDWNISRPKPYMCQLNAILLGAGKPYLCVKAGDTLPDIVEGRDAGMWTIGLALTGNELGLTEEELERLPTHEKDERLAKAYDRMNEINADYVVDTISEVPGILNDINDRLSVGEMPFGFGNS